jgi:hypothetical protein
MKNMDNKKDYFKPLDEMSDDERKDLADLQKDVEIDMLKADVEFLAFTNGVLIRYLVGVANGSISPEVVREELYLAIDMLKNHPTVSEEARLQLAEALKPREELTSNIKKDLN